MKRNFILIFITLINIHIANAQFMSFPTTSYIHTPMGKIPITTSTYMHIPYYFGNAGFSSPKIYTFIVTLKNDSIIKLKSQIDFSESKHFIAISDLKNGYTSYLSDKHKPIRKIYPNDTKEIEAEFDEYGFIGIPNDSCWLFRTNDDIVFTYAMIPEDFDIYTTFFKKRGNNPVLPLTKENVLDLVKDDEELKKEVEKDKKVKLYKIIKRYNKKYTQ